MRAHRLRSALLVLGVAIGVTVLMGMVAILTGLGAKIESEMTSSDSPVVTLSKFDFLTEGNPEDARILARPDITPDDARALEELCGSVGIAEFYVDANRGTVIFRGDQRTRPMFIHGGGARILHVYNLPVALGRPFTDGEVRQRANVVFLGYGATRDLFPGQDPIGKQVRIGPDHYTVVGAGAERESIFGGMGDNYAFVPWTTYRKNLSGPNDPYYAYMTVADGATADDVVDEARAVMRQRHRLRPGDADDFALIPNDRINEFVKRITGPIGLILVALSSIGLAVGGIGVMNIMLVSVTERTREIGIRMALGAKRREILAQFLVEAGTLTGIGGVIGVVLGLLLALLVSKVGGLPASVHPLVALGGVAFSAGIGVFFGLYPASKAAKLDPIEALRYE
jgi:putative ABC transport system permease protein